MHLRLLLDSKSLYAHLRLSDSPLLSTEPLLSLSHGGLQLLRFSMLLLECMLQRVHLLRSVHDLSYLVGKELQAGELAVLTGTGPEICLHRLITAARGVSQDLSAAA